MTPTVSRRAFLAGLATAAASRSIAAQHVELIPRRVERLYRVEASREPNDLQFVPEGLWILDQVDQPTNRALLVDPVSGHTIRNILTESLHGSGITYGNGALWIGSTKGRNAQDPPRTLKVDPQTGKTLKSWVTPGSGLYGRMTVERGDTPSGAHGLKWQNGRYWMAVPAAGKIFLMEPEQGTIVRSIPGPGSTPRTHGLAVEGDALWCINSDDRAIFKLDTRDGTVVGKIQLTREDPVPHGLDIDPGGTLWYCDAATGWICRLTLG